MPKNKLQTAFITPWTYMKAQEQLIPNIFGCESLEPFAPRHSITYFENYKEEKRVGERTTGFDRLHDMTPYDPKKPRCDRAQQALIWAGIYDENQHQKVAKITSHWYGRPNRIQVDYPESKFYRSNKIIESFYRRNNINIDTELERPCQSY